MVKIPVEVPKDCTVRFEAKLWCGPATSETNKALVFKASAEAATLADQEVGLVAEKGFSDLKLEVFPFQRRELSCSKKSGFRRVQVYVFDDDVNFFFTDGAQENQSLVKHSITEMWLPPTFGCEIPGRMRSEYQDSPKKKSPEGFQQFSHCCEPMDLFGDVICISES